jgi:hypothetical protein
MADDGHEDAGVVVQLVRLLDLLEQLDDVHFRQIQDAVAAEADARVAHLGLLTIEEFHVVDARGFELVDGELYVGSCNLGHASYARELLRRLAVRPSDENR